MKQLKETIAMLITHSKSDKSIIERIENTPSVMPFSKETTLLAYLQSINAISFEQYTQIYNDYMVRSQVSNKYLYLFDMAPRTFGQTWGEQHILSLYPQFTQATKENLSCLYPSFDGEFDLWVDGIRVEVKACRANNTKTNESLSSRAYTHEAAKAEGFKYHYQQLKPSCCDVFIWIGVCRDELIYWVLTSDELKHTGKLGSQHRTQNTGVAGADVFEGQVFMTEEELTPYFVQEADVLNTVKNKGKK